MCLGLDSAYKNSIQLLMVVEQHGKVQCSVGIVQFGIGLVQFGKCMQLLNAEPKPPGVVDPTQCWNGQVRRIGQLGPRFDGLGWQGCSTVLSTTKA